MKNKNRNQKGVQIPNQNANGKKVNTMANNNNEKIAETKSVNSGESSKTLSAEDIEKLEAKIQELENKRVSLNNDIEVLTDKKDGLNTDISGLQREKDQLSDKIEHDKKEIAERWAAVLRKEANESHGFIDEKLKIVTEITQQYDESKSKLEESIKDNLKKSIDRVKEEIGESSQMMQKFSLYSKEIEDKFNSELNNFKNKCNEEIKKCKEKKEEYIAQKEEYEEKLKDLKDKEDSVNRKLAALKEEKEGFKESLNKMQENTVNEWKDINAALKTSYIEYNDRQMKELKEYKDAENQGMEEYNLKDSSGVRDMANKIKTLEKEKRELLEKLSNVPSDLDRKKYSLAIKEAENLRNEMLRVQESQKDFELLKCQLEGLKLEKISWEANGVKYEKIKEELEELKRKLGLVGLDENKLSSVVTPYFKPVAEENSTKISEIEWIKRINQKCNESGYIFDDRLLYAFHTALKISNWSPLTVLAGVSGTGKSSLPKLYSRFGGFYFLKVPVQPDWDSPQATFGYFDPLKNKFNATTLLRTMVQASEEFEDTLNDRMVMILLDEMNLAHVELYFSDMLSKLEDRRDGEEPTIEIDVGAGEEKYPVKLTKNVFWVGTMNEDETTKTLSDKVIDRGNVLTFPAPEKFTSRTSGTLKEEFSKISLDLWNNWLNNRVEFEEEEIAFYKETLELINTELRKINRELGNRIWQTVENYMSNYPLVIKYRDDDEKLVEAMNQAFEDAVVQKVMPKLRGIELDGTSKDVLNKIEQILAREVVVESKPQGKKLPPKTVRGLVFDFNKSCSNPYGSFVWSSSEYLKHGMNEGNSTDSTKASSTK